MGTGAASRGVHIVENTFMNTHTARLSALMVSALLCTGSVWAQSATTPSERMSSLPPEQRREIGERLREDWKSMNDQERERLRAERRAYVQSLSPDERRALLRERREMLERMSPEERRRLKRELEH